MRKMICLALATALLCAPVLGVAEYCGIPRLEMKLGAELDLGDRIYTPVKTEILNKIFGTYKFNSQAHIDSGSSDQYACLWLEALNMSTGNMDFFKDAKVQLIYEGERGTYQYEGHVLLCLDSDTDKANKSKDFDPAGPLQKQTFLVYAAVPNYVEDHAGEMRMEIESGEVCLVCVIRE